MMTSQVVQRSRPLSRRMCELGSAKVKVAVMGKGLLSHPLHSLLNIPLAQKANFDF